MRHEHGRDALGTRNADQRTDQALLECVMHLRKPDDGYGDPSRLHIMTCDVTWPKAFKGGFVRGPEEIRAYWSEQWSEIDPHVEPVAFHHQDASQVLVDVQQVVRALDGSVLADERVGHRFTIKDGLIRAMEICPLPAPGAVD